MTSLSIDKGISLSDIYYRSEIAFMMMIVAIFTVNLGVSIGYDRAIAWDSFLVGGGSCVGLVVIGGYIRLVKGAERRAKIVLTIGMNSLFGLMMGIFFHLQMPRPEPVLTEALLQMDHWFGYDWPALVEWTANYKGLGHFLRWIYLTSFFQIVIVMITLAAMNRMRQLDAMLFTNACGLMIVYVIWQLFPNLSQSTYLAISPQVEAATNLLTDGGYGAKLLDMAQFGLAEVRIDNMLGTVAFPSYHMVMLVLVMVFARRTFLFWPLAVVNLIMLPAILIHGAHHIADLVGGTLVLGVALIPGYLLANRFHGGPVFRHRPA